MWIRRPSDRGRKRTCGLFKSEVIRKRGPWRTLEDIELATLAWVWWFNHRRPLEPPGYVPPVEYEEAYYRYQEPQAAVAGPTQRTRLETRRGSIHVDRCARRLVNTG